MRKIALLLLVVVALTSAGCSKKKEDAGSPNEAYCTQARLLDQSDDALDTAFDALNPDALRDAVTSFRAQFDKTKPLAPAAVTADFDFFATLIQQLSSVLESVDYDLSKLTPEQFAQFGSPQVEAAENRLQEHDFTVCQIPKDPSPTVSPTA